MPTPLRSWSPQLIASLLLATVACGSEEGSSLPPSCEEATMESGLDWIQENVLTPSCAAFVSCHAGAATSAGGLNLETGMSEENLVGVESQVVTRLGLGPMNLVEPGDCDASYLVTIMRGEPEELIDPNVGTMPAANPVLCAEKVDAICRWIESL